MRLETKTLPAARLLATLRVPLYRNAYAWMVSTSVSSALGIVYWIVAARFYSAETVGLSAAAVSARIFLSGVAQLNLSSALVRFIPTAGQATRKFVTYSYVIPILLSLVIGALILGGYRFLSLDLAFLGGSRIVGWLVASTVVWSVFNLQDSVLTGLRDAVWVPVENISYAVIKIILLVLLARSMPDSGILVSWMLPVLFTLLPINLLIFRRLIPRHVRATQAQAQPVEPAQLARYVAGNYAGSLSLLASTRLVPVIVTNQAGPAEGAYFFLAWMIASTIKVVTMQMAMSFTVEGAHNPDKLRQQVYRFLKVIAGIFLPVIALLILAAPAILRLLGSTYSQEGSTLLRLLALSMVPSFITLLYISVAQVRRQSSRVFLVQAAFCVLSLGLSFALLRVYGLVGVGIAFLISETLMALILLLTQVPYYRSVLHRKLSGR